MANEFINSIFNKVQPGNGLGNGDKLKLSCNAAVIVIKAPITNMTTPNQKSTSGNIIAIESISKENAINSKN
ncbi:hypothetical protein [Brumimicrobium sp.]|uniref:hypothetical protein n=1 Tax=Brumimicrobium sp. TaxID=2029867 RepID=UPI003A8D89F0